MKVIVRFLVFVGYLFLSPCLLAQQPPQRVSEPAAADKNEVNHPEAWATLEAANRERGKITDQNIAYVCGVRGDLCARDMVRTLGGAFWGKLRSAFLPKRPLQTYVRNSKSAGGVVKPVRKHG